MLLLLLSIFFSEGLDDEHEHEHEGKRDCGKYFNRLLTVC